MRQLNAEKADDRVWATPVHGRFYHACKKAFCRLTKGFYFIGKYAFFTRSYAFSPHSTMVAVNILIASKNASMHKNSSD